MGKSSFFSVSQAVRGGRVVVTGWGKCHKKSSPMLAWEIPWTEVSLVCYDPWGHTESDMTQQLNNKDYVYEKFIL